MYLTQGEERIHLKSHLVIFVDLASASVLADVIQVTKKKKTMVVMGGCVRLVPVRVKTRVRAMRKQHRRELPSEGLEVRLYL